jgi:hypothetical protein
MTATPHPLRQALRYIALAAAVLIAMAVVWTLGPGAGWVLHHVDGVDGIKGKDLEDALDAVRGRALTVGTGLAALVAVYYTARNADTARRTFQLSEQGHVTERYTKAIEQLGSDKLDVRLGGIYALERIAADSVRDHPTVMEVLTAFIREHTARSEHSTIDANENALPPTQPGLSTGTRLTADTQAALTVIGRRASSQDSRDIDLSHARLTDANLIGANLTGANLTRADLTGANLIGADLIGANLTRADLTGADLTGANLTRAHLTRAHLTDAHLTDANLTRANLTDADLTRADLTRADLTRADLTRADLTDADLTRADLTDAHRWAPRNGLRDSSPSNGRSQPSV